MASPDLDLPELATNNLQSLQRLTETLTLVESYALGARERFSAADGRLSGAFARALRAANWPLDPPPVLLMSKEGYWSQPQFGLVFAPPAEDSTLLGLPDLAHEAGHLLLAADERRLAESIAAGVETGLSRSMPVGLGAQDLARRRLAWQSWAMEFAADAIAAYLVGPAYLWQHVRLSIQLGRNPFVPLLATTTHPAPQARYLLVARVLAELDADVQPPTAAWLELQVRGRQAEPLYADVYPETVVATLIAMSTAACREAGIKSFRDAPEDGLIARANEAWARFLADDDPRPWEADVLRRLLKG